MSRILAGFLLSAVLAAAWPPWATAQDGAARPALGEVEVIRAGPRVMYRFVDDNGDIVIQDRPPDWYKIPEVEAVEPWDPTLREAPTPPPAQKSLDLALRALEFLKRHYDWLVPLGFLLAALRFIGPRLPGLPALPALPALGKPPGIRAILRRARIDALHDLVLPLGSGGVIRIDHLARTPSGLLVLHREQAEGVIAGRAEDRVWAEDCAGRQRTLENPIAKVDGRLDAVKALVPGVPVFGRVLLIGGAQFRDGVPMGVLTPTGLRDLLPKFKTGKVPQVALEQSWRTLGRHAGRGSVKKDDANERDPRKITGYALLGAALVTFLLL